MDGGVFAAVAEDIGDFIGFVTAQAIELPERFEALHIERQEMLHDRAIDFTTLADLETWLSQN